MRQGWSRRRAAIAALLLACAAALLLRSWHAPPELRVGPQTSLQSVLATAPEGATIVLGPGTHRGPVTVDHAMTVRGESGARLVAPADADATLTVAASGATVEDLVVQGGVSGIGIREVNAVTIDDVTVTGAQLHGIEVVDASAHIIRARVEDLQSSYAQGIEVRNSDGRPDTVVEDSVVTGGQEGILAHVSEVVFRDNVVTDTTMRAIAVTEMSDGLVESNRVSNTAGVGLYCGDMSRCAFSSAAARNVRGVIR